MSQTLPTIFEIKAVIAEAKGIKTFVFHGDLEFQPGQFVMAWLPRIDEKPLGIWRMKKGEFRLTVSAVGDFSQKFSEQKVGDQVGIRGPLGHGFSILENKKIVLVGGGFGVAPLLGLAERATNCEVHFLIGARSKNLIFGEKYAKKFGKVLLSTNDGSCGEKCFATDLLEKVLVEQKIDKVFSCGPELMMKRVAEICQEKNVDCELSLERYMKCGIGICGSCAMDDSGWCACSDGPVIDGAQALKSGEFGKYHRDSVGVRENF